METQGFVDLKETLLVYPDDSWVALKVGEKFQWINPAVMTPGTVTETARKLIQENGNGPFICLKITRTPAGLVTLSFINKNGEMKEIPEAYFTTCD